MKFRPSNENMSVADAIKLANKIQGDLQLEGRYVKGHFWRAQVACKWCGKTVIVKCFLSSDKKGGKLSTPEQLKSLNWLLDNFESTIKSAFKNEEVIGHCTADSATDFNDDYFKNRVKFYCAYAYLQQLGHKRATYWDIAPMTSPELQPLESTLKCVFLVPSAYR